jgi:hypothetical protein
MTGEHQEGAERDDEAGQFRSGQQDAVEDPMARVTSSDTPDADPDVRRHLVAEHRGDQRGDVTITPAERSNSPPIISSATGTAMMPIVEAA